jgi:hypothetical protein
MLIGVAVAVGAFLGRLQETAASVFFFALDSFSRGNLDNDKLQ